jgi:hypothetical protein
VGVGGGPQEFYGEIHPSEEGTPQGGSVSVMLSNVICGSRRRATASGHPVLWVTVISTLTVLFQDVWPLCRPGGVYAKRPICGSLRVHHQIQRSTLLLLVRDTCGEPNSSHIPDQQHRTRTGDRRGRRQEIVDSKIAVSREGHSGNS